MSYIEGFPNGFALSSPKPIDKKMVVADVTAAPADFLATVYVGHTFYDETTQKHYKVTATDGTQNGLSYAETGVDSLGIYVFEALFGTTEDYTLTWDDTNKIHSVNLATSASLTGSTRSNTSFSSSRGISSERYSIQGVPGGLIDQRLNVRGRLKVEVPDGALDGLNITIKVVDVSYKRSDGPWIATADFDEREEVFLDGIISEGGRWVKFDLSSFGRNGALGYRFKVIVETDGAAKITELPPFVFRIEGN